MSICVITPFHYDKKSGRGSLKKSKRRLSESIESFRSNRISQLVIEGCGEEDKIYSPGKQRNKAKDAADYDFLFFSDADLICTPILNEYLSVINVNAKCFPQQAFEMFPCLYLTKKETDNFDGDFKGCLDSFLRGENHRVERIALASSCLLIKSEWFLKVGGFDESFSGHGGEDLEFIDRLTYYYPVGPRPADYALNIKSQHPGNYQGCRRYFSYYSLHHLFAGRFLVHQWHPRPLSNPYHRQRMHNDKLLELMLARTETQRTPLKAPIVHCNEFEVRDLMDFREWMISLQEEAGYPIQEYPGLLGWREGIKIKRPLWRKLRKLYINPRAFFSDMFNSTSR